LDFGLLKSSAQTAPIADGQFLVSDVGPDHFLVPANGCDNVPTRPEFVAQKIPHLAFDILRGRVIKMIELYFFHHGLLEGSWRFPKEAS
jgi:hypothetical protein